MEPDSFACEFLRRGNVSGFVRTAREAGPRLVRPFLPSLVRMALCSSADMTASWSRCQKEILSILSGIEMVNSIVRYLQVDFCRLKDDVMKRGVLDRKSAGCSGGAFSSSKSPVLALEFENAEADSENCGEAKLRLVLTEVTRAATELTSTFSPYQCELFENDMFVNEVSDILCLTFCELPSLLPLKSVVPALLRVEHGPRLICCLAANMPHKVEQIISILFSTTELQDDISSSSQVRTSVLKQLCSLYPPTWLSVREEAIGLLKLPGLVLTLTINHSSLADPIVSLLTSLLCTANSSGKEWMKQYIKLSRRRMKNIRVGESCFEHLQKQLDGHVLAILDATSVWSVDGRPVVEVTETESGPSRSETPQPAVGPADVAIAVLAEQEETMELGYGTSSEILQEEQLEVVCATGRGEQGSLSLEDAATVLMDSQGKSSRTVTGSSTSTDQEQGVMSPSTDGVGALSESVIDCTHDNLSSIAVLKANCLLRLYSILLGTGVLNLNRVSSQLLMELMTQCPPISSGGVRYVELSISLLMTCPHLASDMQRSQRFTKWLKWLLHNHNKFECLGPGEGRCTEMLLLIAIHFHNGHFEAIVDLVADILGVQGCVRASSFASLRIMFTQDVFTEEVIVEHASRVPITEQLNSNMSGLLPVNCVHEMITTHLFENHGVSIQDWLYRQIQHSTYPLHSLLPVIIQKFVSSLILSSKMESDTRDHGFSETEILSTFSSPCPVPFEQDRNTPQLLMLFYVLAYQQTMMLNVKHNPGLHASYQLHPLRPSILESIPIKPLIKLADCHHERYGELSPLLTCLSSSLFPELCVVEDWLEEEDSSLSVSQNVKIMKDVEAFLSGWIKHKSNKSKLAQLHLRKALTTLDTTDPNTLPCLLHLERLDPKYLLRYTSDLMTSLTIALDQTVSRQIQVLLRNIWFRLNTIIPRRLWIQTVKFLCSDNVTATATAALCQGYTHESLTTDPLIVLRCDERVFRCPPVFEIILQIFKGYLAASKAKLAALSVRGPSELTIGLSHEQDGKNSLAEREELRLALENTQDSVASQLLLQICLPSEQEQQSHRGDRQLSDLQEIRCQVCSFLHQTFISNPTLVKLVHFQGYHLDLIPVLVDGVPSMHICRSFLLELLKQPQLSKQLFAVHLASHLAVRYPLMETMEVGQICFSHLTSLFVSQPKQIRQEVALSILPAVCRFCRAFPLLCEKVAHLLLHVLRAATSSVLMGSTRSTFFEEMPFLPRVNDISVGALTWMNTNTRDCEGQVSHLCIKQDSFILALQCVVSELVEIIRQW